VNYFSVNVSYPGFDREYDNAIHKAAKRFSDGGGYDFSAKRRDVSFYFVRKNAADNAVKRLRAMRPKKRGTRVSVTSVGETVRRLGHALSR